MSDCCSTDEHFPEACPCDGIELLDDSPRASIWQTHPVTRRQAMKYMGGFILTGFIAACGGAPSSPGVGPTGGATRVGTGALTPLDLAFCSQVMCILPFEVANQQGYFAEEGYDLTLIYMKGGTLAMNALLSKSVDFVGTTMDNVVRSVDQGKPAVMVASTSRLPFFALITAPGMARTITSVADLQGKQVGVNNLGTTDDLLIKTLAVQNQVDPESIESVALGPNLYDALLRGDVAAGMVQEPSLTLATQKGSRVLANFMDLEETTEKLGGPYQFMGLNTRPDVIESRPEVLESLSSALVRGNKWILEHSGAEVVRAAPAELVAGGNVQVFADALDKYKASLYPADGRLEQDSIQRVVDAQRAAGLIPADKQIDVQSLYTNRFVDG